MRITFTGRVPSKKNSRRWIKRGARRFSVPSESHEAWHEEWTYKLYDYAGIAAIHPFKQVEVDCKIWAPDERNFDGDNVITSILDLLKDAKIIVDDKVKIVRKGGWEYKGVDRQNPRVEVEIKDYRDHSPTPLETPSL